MRLYIVSGILLIIPIVDSALAAPVQVQQKRQACTDMADMPEYPVTVLPKRGEIEEVGGKYIENWFVLPKDSSVAHGASSSAPSEPGHVSTGVMNAPAPNPGLSTESDHSLSGMEAPLTSPVYPTWFHPDNQLLGAHAPPQNTVPSNPSTELNSENRLVVEQPLSPTKGSSTAPVPPSSRALSTDPNRESMSADSPWKNL
jgi:hypothetical protein